MLLLIIFLFLLMCFSIGLTCIQLQDGLARIGPWGGDGGTCHDINATPRRLESVTISSCLVIDSITFSFSDDNGQKHYAGPWGGSGGFDHKVRLNSNVYRVFQSLVSSYQEKSNQFIYLFSTM